MAKIKIQWSIQPLTLKLVKALAKKNKQPVQVTAETLILKSLSHEK